MALHKCPACGIIVKRDRRFKCNKKHPTSYCGVYEKPVELIWLGKGVIDHGKQIY